MEQALKQAVIVSRSTAAKGEGKGEGNAKAES